MSAAPLPALLCEAGMEPVVGHVSHEREARLWTVRWDGVAAIGRQLDPAAVLPPGPEATVAGRRWIHDYLRELSATGFAVPEPLPAFDGGSVTVRDGFVWEVLTYLPGEPIAWRERPSMF